MTNKIKLESIIATIISSSVILFVVLGTMNTIASTKEPGTYTGNVTEILKSKGIFGFTTKVKLDNGEEVIPRYGVSCLEIGKEVEYIYHHGNPSFLFSDIEFYRVRC